MITDSLAGFTASLAASGGGGPYRDGPFSGYAKDLTGLANAYKTSWLSKAAVERIPEDCFKRGYTWIAEPDQVNLIEAVEKRHQIKQKKKKALMLARLDGEAYIYFDLGDDAGEPLSLDRVKVGGLRFVSVLRRTEIVKGPRVADPMSEFYGQPEYYEVVSASDMVRIHPSRVCAFIRNPDPATGDGVSDLAHLLGPIIAAETARDNTVALTTEARIDVMKVKGLMDAIQDPETEAAIVKRYELVRQLKATNKMIVMDLEGEDYSQKQSSFATLPDIIQTMRREVCAALEIPYALIFGREGSLGSNGDTDLTVYYDAIKTMQETDIGQTCEPLDEAVLRSALGSRPDGVYLQWASLWEMTDKEKAEVADKLATAAEKMVSAGMVPADIMGASVVNAMSELGAFPGIEENYSNWVNQDEGLDDGDNSA